jgi:aminoglycoside/choline kinase family phosphotransferase
MGTIVRLRLTLDQNSDTRVPASLIVKLPTFDKKIKAQGELLGIYEREILFYDELASHLPDPGPRCYYSAMDPNPASPEAQLKRIDSLARMPEWLIRLMIPIGPLVTRLSRRRYVLLLEDMAPASVGNQLGGGTPGEIEAMLRNMARMHAHFWNSPLIDSKHWISGVDVARRPLRLMYQRYLPAFEARYGARIGEAFQRVQRWLLEHSEELVEEFQRGPFTLLHGDFRLDNVFFRTGGLLGEGVREARRGEDVALIDWQIPAQGPGAYDLSYFLTSTLAPETSTEEETALLHLYHETLQAHGVEGYDLETLEFDYRKATLLMAQRLTSALTGIETTNDRGRGLFEAWVDRLNARIERLDLDSLLKISI